MLTIRILLLILFVCILSGITIIIITRKQHVTDHFRETIPIEIRRRIAMNVNVNESHTDLFVRDLLLEEYQVFIRTTDQEVSFLMHKCSKEECDSLNRTEYVLDKSRPIFTKADINKNQHVRFYELFGQDMSHSIPITIKVIHELPLNATISMETFDKLVQNNKLIVSCEENIDARQQYDLFACTWDDQSKSAKCQKIEWQAGIKSEIDFAKNYDMIRIVPKNKPL